MRHTKKEWSTHGPLGAVLLALVSVITTLSVGTTDAFAQAPACNAAHITAPSTPLQTTAALPFRDWRDHQRADEARWCPNIVAADLTWYTTRRPALVTLLGTCSFADVGITDVQTADQVPCRTFDLDSLPPAAPLLRAESAEGKVEFFGTTVPQAFRGLATNGDIRSDTPAVTAEFPAAGKAAFEEFVPPGGSAKVRDEMYEWYRSMGYNPVLAVAAPGAPAPAVTPTTPWTCPAPVVGTIGKCVGYEAALIGSVRPIIDRINRTTARAAVVDNPATPAINETQPAYLGDAARSAAMLTEATAMDPSGPAPAPGGVVPTAPRYPENQRVLMIAAAYQFLAPKYQAFYRAEYEGGEALASLPADDAGLQPLVGQQVTFFRWGQEAVKGRVASVTLPVTASPGPPPVVAVLASISVQPEGTPPPATVTLTVTEINGTPAVTTPAVVAAVLPTARLFVAWPPAWREAREAVSYHGRSRILTPTDPTTGLTAFEGREVEVINLDRRTLSGELDVAVEVLETADVASTSPTYTLRGGSSTGFNPFRAIFFGGSEVGGGTAVSLPVGVTVTPQLGMLMCTDGDATCVGGTEGALLRYSLNNNVALVARVALMQLGTWRHNADQFKDTAQWSPLVTLGVNPGFSAGDWRFALLVDAGTAGLGGIVEGMADITYANNFNFAVGYARLLHVQGDENQRLFRELPRRFDGGAFTSTVGWMF